MGDKRYRGNIGDLRKNKQTEIHRNGTENFLKLIFSKLANFSRFFIALKYRLFDNFGSKIERKFRWFQILYFTFFKAPKQSAWDQKTWKKRGFLILFLSLLIPPAKWDTRGIRGIHQSWSTTEGATGEITISLGRNHIPWWFPPGTGRGWGRCNSTLNKKLGTWFFPKKFRWWLNLIQSREIS